MKKTMKRGLAVLIYKNLSVLPFGHMSAELLEKAMMNMDALSTVAERHDKLMQELSKRLGEGVDEARAEAYNKAVERNESEDTLKKMYPDLVELAQKQSMFSESISVKEIEIEVEPMDRNEFIKAVLKGKPDVAYGLFALFSPLFSEDKKEEEADDFSELDELMK